MVLTATLGAKHIIVAGGHALVFFLDQRENDQSRTYLPFSVAIRNEELMHEYFPKHV